MKMVIAALAGLMLLPLSSTARAGSNELTEYVRKLLEADDLPVLADDADLRLVDDGKAVKLTAEQLRAANAEEKRVLQSYKLKDFKVLSADCGQKLCFIRYTQRVSAKMGNKDILVGATSEEVYVETDSGFTLVRAYQVQHKEGEL